MSQRFELIALPLLIKSTKFLRGFVSPTEAGLRSMKISRVLTTMDN